MSKRIILARIAIGNDEIVVTLDDRDRIDIRLWTATGGVRMASANGLTLPLIEIPNLIAALETAMKEGAA